MNLSGSRKMRCEFFLAVMSVLVFSWLITVESSLGQYGDAVDSAAGPRRGNIKGVVVSADKNEVTIKSHDEGRVIVLRVPMQQRPNGRWTQSEEIANFTASLEPGDKVDADYNFHGETSMLRFIKKATGSSGVFVRQRNLITCWVISGTEDDVTVETAETGKVMVLRVPMRRREDGTRVKMADLVEKVGELRRGQLVLARYSRGEEEGVYFLRDVKELSFARNERIQLIRELSSLQRRLAQLQKTVKEILGREPPMTDRRPD